MKYEGSDEDPADWFSLKHRKVDENGFLVVCNSDNGGQSTNSASCDHYDSIADISGDDRVAIMKCPDGCESYTDECNLIDIYGEIGVNLEWEEHFFSSGRAFRMSSYTIASAVWQKLQWTIVVPSYFKDCTPRNRNDPLPEPVTEPDEEGVICEKRPSEAYYLVTGDSCAESDNSQMNLRRFLRKLKTPTSNSQSFQCNESNFDSIGNLQITINGVYKGEFSIGDTLVITDSPTNMEVGIRRGGGTQTILFHSSCSKPFAIGDTFGSLKFEAFRNDPQGLVPSNYLS